ncbi:MAG: Fe-S protein assembly co-chaperone HscB, partial [Nitrospirae bacterium]|nr:Fe-S protein assembly co-chaperone HscB [Nitrospirota bacterium]
MGGEYFCDHCVKIQPAPPQRDYFQRFGLSRHLTIDLQDLEQWFHKLSRKFHPDLFQRGSDQEKAISLENSALLNTAYRTIRDPILRVEYLIRLEEGAVKDIPAKAPPDLLEE